MSSLSELNAALLQAVITMGIAASVRVPVRAVSQAVLPLVGRRVGLYVLRIGAICGFLTTASEPWLYVHQVLTGWTALALLGAALAFSQRVEWRRWYLALVLFPPLWSYVAIYGSRTSLLAAGRPCCFSAWRHSGPAGRSGATTGVLGSRAAGFVAGVLVLWGLHHLDYPLLRARGAWNPWGYYLDICFVLALGAGILLLVVEDLRRGSRRSPRSRATSSSAGITSPRDGRRTVVDSLLARPLALGASAAARCA
jgi:hypothetical protein